MIYFCINNAHGPTRAWSDQSYIACYWPAVIACLHWLPIVQRIHFKVTITVFKAMHNTAPAYLQELIVPYVPSRGLRSQEHNLLCVPFTRSILAGSRAFSIAGPKLWNALPQYLRDISDIAKFKRQLKTRLFDQHYGQ